jgi:hypothetical protein
MASDPKAAVEHGEGVLEFWVERDLRPSRHQVELHADMVRIAPCGRRHAEEVAHDNGRHAAPCVDTREFGMVFEVRIVTTRGGRTPKPPTSASRPSTTSTSQTAAESAVGVAGASAVVTGPLISVFYPSRQPVRLGLGDTH